MDDNPKPLNPFFEFGLTDQQCGLYLFTLKTFAVVIGWVVDLFIATSR